MRICLSCGTIAPTCNDKCWRCSDSFDENTQDVPPHDHGLLPARIQGHFECRSCGKPVPLNHLALDTVPCGSCGIDQAVKWELWDEILTHAHNTADLTGQNKPSLGDALFWDAFREEEGEEVVAMFRNIGRQKSTLTKGNSYFGGIDYELDVSPGYPTCESCKVPLALKIADESLKANCPSCGDSAEYPIWKESDKYSGLVAAMALEHRIDNAPVKTDKSKGGGAVAITCPNCGGDLQPDAQGGIITCAYCDTVSHVPMRLQQQVTGKPVPERAWWLFFKGDSPWRKVVARRTEIIAHKREIQKQARLKQLEDEANEELTRQQSNQTLILLVIGIFAVLGIIAYLLSGM